VAGLGLPYTYWHRLAYVQVFEGPDRVILFVEVAREMDRPGLFPGAYPYHFAAALLRIDVFPDGRVERTNLGFDCDDGLTFNTNLYALARLADGFYLVKMFGEGAPKPAYRMGPDGRLWPASKEVIRATGQDVARAGRDPFDLSGGDAVSLRRGWRRLSQESGHGPYLLISGPIDSTRHGVRLRHLPRWLREHEPESIVAESISSADRWTRTLIEVDTRRWKSYKDPSDRAYLRARYAASPAR
jgi:hypothetical protein